MKKIQCPEKSKFTSFFENFDFIFEVLRNILLDPFQRIWNQHKIMRF